MTGVRFTYQPVFAILLIWPFSTCYAADSQEPNDPNRSPNAVRTFADNVLKYGRNTYGPKHTPLLVDDLNRQCQNWRSRLSESACTWSSAALKCI